MTSWKNITKQEHRASKRIVKPMLRFKTFNTAGQTLSEIEAMSMICKRQVQGFDRGDSMSQVKVIEALFNTAA
ncbi:hypothetical protein [Leptolyngbya sp. FACHB-321]|uniref:hypothetical protein n=1 Tax=Leptolyngbya sp. FACHB-321 TaxID=2692807 RepID=UPI00168701BA|nr:hypothetical protein [Leptolyngbya sp. FACHB-321]